jgi:hypothetical protein
VINNDDDGNEEETKLSARAKKTRQKDGKFEDDVFYCWLLLGLGLPERCVKKRSGDTNFANNANRASAKQVTSPPCYNRRCSVSPTMAAHCMPRLAVTFIS